jgi:hypothetical protein
MTSKLRHKIVDVQILDSGALDVRECGEVAGLKGRLWNPEVFYEE